VIGVGLDLGFTIDDTVVFKEFPDFEYRVEGIEDGGETIVCSDGDVSGFALPGLALRKKTDDDE
jgi:hypothetical protein